MSHADPTAPARQSSLLRRVLAQVLGWALLLIGLAALALPGPGLLLLAVGLTVLSTQYAWARRRVHPVRERAHRLAADSVSSWRTIALSLLLALGLIAIGVVWGLRPPAPGFWPLDDRWWLPGGWGTGSSLIGSGVIAVALLVWSRRRFGSGGADAQPAG